MKIDDAKIDKLAYTFRDIRLIFDVLCRFLKVAETALFVRLSSLKSKKKYDLRYLAKIKSIN